MSDGNNQDQSQGSSGPPHLQIKGGPNKIVGVGQSAEEARKRREQFEKELEEREDAESQQEPCEDDNGPPNEPPAGGFKLRGGPNKIAGVMQSAKDAQAARDKYEQEHADDDTNPPGEPSHGAPYQGIRLRGGPMKIAGVRQSAEEAQEARERVASEGGSAQDEHEQSSSSGHGNSGGIEVRGGPNKIIGIMDSAKRAQGEQAAAAAGRNDPRNES